MKDEQRIKGILECFVRRGRLLVVDGTKWRWRCGKGGNVIAYSEHGERRCAWAWTIKGITPDEFERGKWKITSSGMVKPSDVANWLSTPKGGQMKDEQINLRFHWKCDDCRLTGYVDVKLPKQVRHLHSLLEEDHFRKRGPKTCPSDYFMITNITAVEKAS